MPPRLPDAIREEALVLIDRGLSDKDIAFRLNISSNQVWKMKRNLRLYGTIAIQPTSIQGRPRLLTLAMEDALLQYFMDRPISYLDEAAWFIYDEFEVIISPRSIYDVLKRRKWSRKAVGLFFLKNSKKKMFASMAALGFEPRSFNHRAIF